MTEYALDTDTATLLLYGHAQVCARAAAVEPEQLSVTIITVEEILTGWYSQIRRAKNNEQLLRAYSSLQQAVEFLARVRILPMDEEALEQFHAFRKGKQRMGSNDLKMAAIAKRHGVALVTRNMRDFKRLAGVKLEDWSG
jgi:tRNA(fMet)-specific endonuclease VapC